MNLSHVMKLANETKFTGWFGLAMTGYILVALNALALLGVSQLGSFTKLLSVAITAPGLFLLGRFGFLICQRLQDGERERASLQRDNEELRRATRTVAGSN
jgi:hypothetical protein